MSHYPKKTPKNPQFLSCSMFTHSDLYCFIKKKKKLRCTQVKSNTHTHLLRFLPAPTSSLRVLNKAESGLSNCLGYLGMPLCRTTQFSFICIAAVPPNRPPVSPQTSSFSQTSSPCFTRKQAKKSK